MSKRSALADSAEINVAIFISVILQLAAFLMLLRRFIVTKPGDRMKYAISVRFRTVECHAAC
jgi:biopolymer transport protein ExbD